MLLGVYMKESIIKCPLCNESIVSNGGKTVCPHCNFVAYNFDEKTAKTDYSLSAEQLNQQNEQLLSEVLQFLHDPNWEENKFKKLDTTKVNDDTFDSLIKSVNYMRSENRYDDAVNACEKLLQARPNDARALFLKADSKLMLIKDKLADGTFCDDAEHSEIITLLNDAQANVENNSDLLDTIVQTRTTYEKYVNRCKLNYKQKLAKDKIKQLSTPEKTKNKVKLTAKDYDYDPPEPIDFPGASDNKIIKIGFWIYAAITLLFSFAILDFWCGFGVFNLKISDYAITESVGVTVAAIAMFVGLVGWIGYYIFRKFAKYDSLEPTALKIIRRTSVIAYVASILYTIWQGALYLLYKKIPEFALPGATEQEVATTVANSLSSLKTAAIILVSALGLMLLIASINTKRKEADVNGENFTFGKAVESALFFIEMAAFLGVIVFGIVAIINLIFPTFIPGLLGEGAMSVIYTILIVCAILFVVLLIVDAVCESVKNKKNNPKTLTKEQLLEKNKDRINKLQAMVDECTNLLEKLNNNEPLEKNIDEFINIKTNINNI